MSFRFISVSASAGVTTLRLDRPEVLNAIHAPMHQELHQALDAFAADPAQRVCVITGSGERAFCAGSDLKQALASGLTARILADTYPASGYAGIARRFDLAKPVIAAVNGLALGGGFEIALACDIIVAVEEATFGLPEPLVGAVALGGGVHRLARQIGLKKALGLILTGRSVSAAEGLSLGFVNEVVRREQLPAALARWTQDILRCAPAAIAASKEAVYRGLDEPSLEQALARQDEYPQFAAWRKSDEAPEGVRAFVEKRAPRWTQPG
jgi:enoyl-CoA hydratase/carnithine racemase